MTRSHVPWLINRRALFMWDTALCFAACGFETQDSHLTWLMRDVTQSSMWRIHAWLMRDVTHLYTWLTCIRDSFIRDSWGTWLVPVRASFISDSCVTWLVQVHERSVLYIYIYNIYIYIFEMTCAYLLPAHESLQHTATPCNTLQHTANHCSSLQHSATLCNTLQSAHKSCQLSGCVEYARLDIYIYMYIYVCVCAYI